MVVSSSFEMLSLHRISDITGVITLHASVDLNPLGLVMTCVGAVVWVTPLVGGHKSRRESVSE